MKNGTQNFCAAELFYMQERKKSKADEIGKRVPYHLEYIRKHGNVEVKPIEQT